MSRLILASLAAILVVRSGVAQYRAPRDTQFVLLINPYRMYWVRGADTLSQDIHSVSVEAQSWRATGSLLSIAIRQLPLDVHRRVRVDTFVVTPQGVLQSVNGHPPGLNERVDLLLRIPKGALAPGRTWADTLLSEQDTPSGRRGFAVMRSYRVSRAYDSSGTRLVEVAATGVVHYRDRWWIDSVAGTWYSMDVSGSDTERFVYAVDLGRLMRRTWSMNLTGTGAVPSATGGMDTIPAGLISGEAQQVLAPERAHLLMRSMPGVDSAVTLSGRGGSGGVIFLHTVARGPDLIESGMARNDGLLGTTSARFSGGVLQTFDAVWTDTAVTARHTTVSLSGDSLRIRDLGHSDTSVAIPAPSWAVGDYAMNELLVPSLLRHQADGVQTPFAIYRPYARHWDVGTATLRPLGEYLLASYLMRGDSLPTFLLTTKDGDLLMGENSGPKGAQRVPIPGSARRSRLDAFLKTLRQ